MLLWYLTFLDAVYGNSKVYFVLSSFRLNIWDVGGQKTLRSYWRNYYEQTDGMVWVVDSSDLRRLNDCRDELHGLLREEVQLTSSVPMYAHLH